MPGDVVLPLSPDDAETVRMALVLYSGRINRDRRPDEFRRAEALLRRLRALSESGQSALPFTAPAAPDRKNTDV